LIKREGRVKDDMRYEEHVNLPEYVEAPLEEEVVEHRYHRYILLELESWREPVAGLQPRR
jgi:hypothetical protein